MDSFRTWAAQWGNIASVLGIALTIVGFAFSLVGIRRSKSAAERAAAAAGQARDAINFTNSIAELAGAQAILEEIKRLQRENAWRVIPDRYSTLRLKLIGIRGSGSAATEEQRQVLQGAIAQLAELEQKIERALARNTTPPNPAKFNEIVSTVLGQVHGVLTDLQQKRSA
jgi:hypothetical protein